jgi:hypothetical protein
MSRGGRNVTIDTESVRHVPPKSKRLRNRLLFSIVRLESAFLPSKTAPCACNRLQHYQHHLMGNSFALLNR